MEPMPDLANSNILYGVLPLSNGLFDEDAGRLVVLLQVTFDCFVSPVAFPSISETLRIEGRHAITA